MDAVSLQVSSNDVALRRVLRAFSLEPLSMSAMPRSTVCAVYRARTSEGDFAVKVYPRWCEDDYLAREIDLVSCLKAGGCRVSEYVPAAGGRSFVVTEGGEKVAVYRWVSGRTKDALGRDDLVRLLETVCAMHVAATGRSCPRDASWMWSDQRAYASALEVPPSLASRVRAIVAAPCPWEPSPTDVPCHNDLTLGNVVWTDDDEPYVIDFTNAIECPREWDVAVLVASLALSKGPVDLATTIGLAVRVWARNGAPLEEARLWSYLDVALVQRAVFRAYGARGTPSASAVWPRLERALFDARARAEPNEGVACA